MAFLKVVYITVHGVQSSLVHVVDNSAARIYTASQAQACAPVTNSGRQSLASSLVNTASAVAVHSSSPQCQSDSAATSSLQHHHWLCLATSHVKQGCIAKCTSKARLALTHRAQQPAVHMSPSSSQQVHPCSGLSVPTSHAFNDMPETSHWYCSCGWYDYGRGVQSVHNSMHITHLVSLNTTPVVVGCLLGCVMYPIQADWILQLTVVQCR